MYLDANGSIGVEIEPTIDLESLVKFPDSKWTPWQLKPSCIYAHSN